MFSSSISRDSTSSHFPLIFRVANSSFGVHWKEIQKRIYLCGAIYLKICSSAIKATRASITSQQCNSQIVSMPHHIGAVVTVLPSNLGWPS